MSEREPADPFDSPMSQGVFDARGRTYTLGHVLAAAAFGGWVGDFWKTFEDSLCCAAYAAEEGFDIEPAELQAAADRMRLERNLVTAEETERWLAERHVDEDELAGYLERRYWHSRFCPQAAELRQSYGPAPEELAGVLWPEVVFSGSLGRLAVPLARRVAAAAAAGCIPGSLPGWPARDRYGTAWHDELRGLDACFQQARSEALSPRRSRAALETRRLDLVRVRLVAARFATEAQAREACLCITDDGEEFEPAARRAAACTEEQTLLLEDAAAGLGPRLLSAAPGEIVLVTGPGAETSIVKVVDKTMPGIDDPEVCARLEPGLLSQYFDPLVEAEVRWAVPLEPGS